MQCYDIPLVIIANMVQCFDIWVVGIVNIVQCYDICVVGIQNIVQCFNIRKGKPYKHRTMFCYMGCHEFETSYDVSSYGNES